MKTRFRVLGVTSRVWPTALLTVAAGAFSIGILLATDRPPAVLEKSETGRSVPVSRQTFDGRKAVDVKVDLEPGGQITSPRSGTLTAVSCSVGAPLAPYQSHFAIDGVPLMTVVSASPLWRDLHLGDVGGDVDDLRRSLREAGDNIAASGPVDSSMVDAFNERLHAAAEREVHGSIDRSSLVWLNSSASRVSHCPISLGASVLADDALAGVAPSVSRASIAEGMEGRAALGAVVVELSGDSFAVSSDGSLPEPGRIVVELPDSNDSAENVESGGTLNLQGTLRLKKSIQVLVVPPSSLVTVGDSSCVFNAGVANPVTIVGSELGKTFIRELNSPTLTAVDLVPPDDAKCPSN